MYANKDLKELVYKEVMKTTAVDNWMDEFKLQGISPTNNNQ